MKIPNLNVTLTPKKNHYHNTNNGKVRILTKGKIYKSETINYLKRYYVLSDIGNFMYFQSSLFITIDKIRDTKIDEVLK